MSKGSARRKERAKAFQVIYSLEFLDQQNFSKVRRAFLQVPNTQEFLQDDAEVITEPSGFAWELVLGVAKQVKALDEIINEHSHNWRVDRLGKIELTLLRLSIYEMCFLKDVTPKMALSEALDLYSRFGEQQTIGFINGILDGVVKKMEAQQASSLSTSSLPKD